MRAGKRRAVDGSAAPSEPLGLLAFCFQTCPHVHNAAMPRKPPTLGKLSPKRRHSAAARGYGSKWRKLRRLVAADRPAVCMVCGRAEISRAMHLDHVIPLAQGGTNDPDNLQWLCAGCHSRKTVEQDGGFGR